MSDIQLTDYSTHAITVRSDAPLPTSADGSLATRCNRYGQDTSKGRFIKWFEVDQSGDKLWRYGKLVKPEEKILPIDLDEMRRELKGNAKYDIFAVKPRTKMEARISKIYMKMRVSYLHARTITEPNTDVDICLWGLDENNKERILINPYILMGKMAYARMIMQRAVLHRALCRGRENLGDKRLARFVMDICANRIMAATTTGKVSKAWNKLCQYLYPDESKFTVLALANSSLEDADLRKLRRVNPAYAEIWESLYDTGPQEIEYETPKTKKKRTKKVYKRLKFDIRNVNPDDLYFRLRSQLTYDDRMALSRLGVPIDENTKGMNPFGMDEDSDCQAPLLKMPGGGGEGEGEEQKNQQGGGQGKNKNEVKMPNGSTIRMMEDCLNIASESAREAEEALRKSLVPKRLQGGLGWKKYSDCRTEFWDKFIKTPEDISDPGLDRYAEKIYTEKIMRDVAGRITEVLENDIMSRPYPQILTEEGTMMAIMGMRPPVYPLFQNQEGTEGKRRVLVFFDLSPSMTEFFPHMMYMCDTFEEKADIAFSRNDDGDSGVMSFAGSIKELDENEIAQMRAGEVFAGASTCFDEVIEYCNEKIQTDDVDAVIIFTDGLSGLSQQNADIFNGSGKRAYRIYMQEDSKTNRNGGSIQSPLDSLEGESYTINVPKTDIMYSRRA
jgi:hypothetical protein